MKLNLGFVTLSAVVAMSAQAVDLNKDALKDIQKQGHAMIEEAKQEQSRKFKSTSGHCLDFAGKALLIKNCSGNANTQNWRFDDQSRLRASDGRCVVGNATLQSCGTGAGQKWALNNQGRLKNGAGKCLQPQGNPMKAGSKVNAADCNQSSKRQVWK